MTTSFSTTSATTSTSSTFQQDSPHSPPPVSSGAIIFGPSGVESINSVPTAEGPDISTSPRSILDASSKHQQTITKSVPLIPNTFTTEAPTRTSKSAAVDNAGMISTETSLSSIGNEVAAWLIAIEDAGLFMYVKVLRQAG